MRVAYDVLEGRLPTGPTFVCAPGLGDVRAEYRRLAPLLASRSARVIRMDLRGMGESDSSFAPSELTPDATGRDVLALLEQERVGRAIVVGTSMAAASVAYAAAKDGASSSSSSPAPRPPRIAGAVFISPFLWDQALPAGVATLLNMMMNRWTGPAFWASYYAGLYPLKKSVPDFPFYLASLQQHLGEGGGARVEVTKAHLLASKAACTAELPALGARRLPVLAIFGGRDPDYKDAAAEAADVAERLRKGYAGGAGAGLVRTHVVNGAGHYPHVEAPEEVAETIFSFVAAHGLG